MTAEAHLLIGRGACLVCGDAAAQLKLMKTGRVCMTCNACKVQLFARGDKADQLIRDRFRPVPAAAVVDEPPPVDEPPKRRGSFGVGLPW